MEPSADPTSPARAALARFLANNSPQGRLAHYMRGRVRGFWLRQTLTGFGSLTLTLLESPGFGLILLMIALGGELFELALLRLAGSRLAGTGRLAPASRICLLAAGVQAVTIAGCVVLTWHQTVLQEAHFFAMVFLIAAMINAGLPRSLFPDVADLRMAIYFVTGIATLGVDHSLYGYAVTREYGYEAASFGLLCYISFLFIKLLEHNQRQRRRNEFALLQQQLAQEDAGIELARTVEDNKRLALVAKYATDSILISAPDGRIQWVNDAFSALTGYDFDEAVGKYPADLLNATDTDPKTVEKLSSARRDKVPVRVEILNRTKTGRQVWIETSIIPVFEEDGTHKAWIAVERDISQAKVREEELAGARNAAEEAGQAKSRFLANMSHEIRTPMNGVIGVAELLAETRLTPVQANYVETIIESGRALLSVINDILDLAKLQSGKATLERRPFSVRNCVESALRVLGPAAAKKGVELRLEGEAGTAMVMGDEGKIRQVVLNLVGNAIKFTPQGYVTLRFKLPGPDNPNLRIEVEDTGIGIAPDRVKAIFESFSQADSGIGRQYGGTGLGLTICAMLADQMGGEISVQSDLGRGSIFTFRAELPAVAALDLPADPIERRREPRLRAGLRVLVAEDNRTNMMIVRKMLTSAVQSLGEAANGEEVVAMYRDRPPDLVLMDVSMPIKDGLQATRDIRAHEALAGLPHCPIIALTANAFGEDRAACLAAGMDGFLTKPLSRQDLLAAIATHFPEHPKSARVIGL